ncbi:MAG: hypothetical protein ACRETK_01440, partial [Steroidobacteraceae bacterium]
MRARLREVACSRIACSRTQQLTLELAAPVLQALLTLEQREYLAALLETGAHLSHSLREFADARARLRPLQVPKDLVAILDRRDAAQRRVKYCLQPVLVAAGEHRLDDRIQMQIGEALRGSIGSLARRRFLVQDALKAHAGSTQAVRRMRGPRLSRSAISV